MVKNLPFDAGDVGSIPGQGAKILHASGKLSPLHNKISPRTSVRTQHSQNFFKKEQGLFIQVSQPELLIMGDRGVSGCMCGGGWRASFTRESHFLLSGRQRRVRVSVLHFLSNFNSESTTCHRDVLGECLLQVQDLHHQEVRAPRLPSLLGWA